MTAWWHYALAAGIPVVLAAAGLAWVIWKDYRENRQ
jgi:hypothetical protein